MHNELFALRNTQIVSNFLERRAAFEAKWFNYSAPPRPSGEGSGATPASVPPDPRRQWFRRLYHTDSEFFVLCFNRSRSGL